LEHTSGFDMSPVQRRRRVGINIEDRVIGRAKVTVRGDAKLDAAIEEQLRDQKQLRVIGADFPPERRPVGGSPRL
jgi:hypothetical protein